MRRIFGRFPAFLGIIVVLALSGSSAQGQGFPGRPRSSGGADSGPQRLTLDEEEPDTFPIYFLFAGNPGQAYAFSDSLLDDFFHQYDPARKRTWDYKNLGVPGSAHQALVYEPRLRRGFDAGFHQYDLYLLAAESVPFYRLQKAYTNLGFNRGAEQNNSDFSAQFSRNFANGLNFSLDYRRLGQLGTADLFPNQRVRNTSLGLGFWLQAKNGRYQGFFAYADNKLEHDDNGGIVEEPVREGAFFTPNATDVYLDNAGTRHRHQEILYTHYLDLVKRDTLAPDLVPDSLTPPRRFWRVSHRIGYRSSTYKFFDASPASDASYYGLFQTDNRGLRHFLLHNKLENQFRLQLVNHNRGPGRDRRLEFHLTHVVHQINQEPVDSSLQEIFIGADWAAAPLPSLQLDAQAQLGVLGSIGDYRLKGQIRTLLGGWGGLEAVFLNQLYSPALVQESFYVTQQPVWGNEFKKTLETNLQGKLFVSGWGLELGGAYHLINQAIYFDTAGAARQTGAPVSISQLFVRKHLRLWKIHSENQWAVQSVSGDVLRLPLLTGKHSLYFSGKLFKVLDTRIGFDLRYSTAYYSDYYFPLTGQFQLQDRVQIPFYPAVDAHFNIRVTKFRAFVKLENISSNWMNGQLFYQTPDYPWPPVSGFRIGIKWRLSD